VPNPITLDELRKLKASGAEVEIEQDVTSIVELPALIAQMQEMAASTKAIADKDLSAVLKSIAVAVGKLKPESGGIDMAPVLSSLEALKISLAVPRNAPAYTFTVDRDNRGRIATVKAVPSNG
jgi:hypothetical protein